MECPALPCCTPPSRSHALACMRLARPPPPTPPHHHPPPRPRAAGLPRRPLPDSPAKRQFAMIEAARWVWDVGWWRVWVRIRCRAAACTGPRVADLGRRKARRTAHAIPRSLRPAPAPCPPQRRHLCADAGRAGAEAGHHPAARREAGAPHLLQGCEPGQAVLLPLRAVPPPHACRRGRCSTCMPPLAAACRCLHPDPRAPLLPPAPFGPQVPGGWAASVTPGGTLNAAELEEEPTELELACGLLVPLYAARCVRLLARATCAPLAMRACCMPPLCLLALAAATPSELTPVQKAR